MSNKELVPQNLLHFADLEQASFAALLLASHLQEL